MNFKYVGPLALLAALVIGDQIRINRPNHKYRLTVEVETPEGVKSASGVMAVHPDRSYSRGGKTSTKGDAVFVDLGGGKNLVALLAHLDKSLELDEINYVALRAYKAAGQNVTFNQMSRVTGTVPVKGEVIPVLVSFADPADPATARVVPPDGSRGRAGQRHPASRHFGRGGAERRLAARFRRPARRSRDPRDRGEIAVAERCGQCGGQGASGRGIAERRGHRFQGCFHAEIAMQAGAAAWHIDPVQAGRHDLPETRSTGICDVRLEAMQ